MLRFKLLINVFSSKFFCLGSAIHLPNILVLKYYNLILFTWSLNSSIPLFLLPSTVFPSQKKFIYWEKWVDLTLDHILQDQSPDLSPALGQDPDHTLEKRDTGIFMSYYVKNCFLCIEFCLEVFFHLHEAGIFTL